MKSERVKELIDYVNLLKSLLVDGFKCEIELNEALRQLHRQMLSKSEETKIIIFEKDFEGVIKSVKIFSDILGEPDTQTRYQDNIDLKFGNTYVIIKKVSTDKVYAGDKHRGMTVDYAINNTGVSGFLNNCGVKFK